MKPVYLLLIKAFIFSFPSCAFAQKADYIEKKITILNKGWELKGDLILIKGKSKSPVVLLLNKANGNRKVYEILAKELAKKNISSLRLDLRGHGESINMGRFIPFDSLNNDKLLLNDGYTDIITVHKYLIALKETDSTKIGIVGASYSGEDMMIASRKFKQAKSYVALSPGSFSQESIQEIDSYTIPMLFIKSNEERSMQGFEQDVFSKSKKAQIHIVAGKTHATDILASYPGLNVFIADWFKNHL